MKGKTGSDYKYRANVQKIDAECLKWFLDEQEISYRELATKTSVSDRTIRNWMKRGEMPAYLIDEICEALALESVCDMRENAELKCSEPVTTFRYRDAAPDEGKVKLHARIGVEIVIPKELFLQVFRKAMNEDGGFSDLDFDDATAQLFLDKGKAAWDDHYIPSAWLIQDALDAGIIKDENDIYGKANFKEDVSDDRRNNFMMEFTIEDLVKILRNGVKMCAATNTTLVHITVEAAREAAYYLEDLAMLISDSGKGGESG